jgi:hypothetical protein
MLTSNGLVTDMNSTIQPSAALELLDCQSVDDSSRKMGVVPGLASSDIAGH